MEKKRITYGVHGMMEYQAVIKMGKSLMKVNFADGSISAMGVTPATFTTDNPITQVAIENSADYKRGLIKTINVITMPGEVKVVRNTKAKAGQTSGEDSAPTPTTTEETADTEVTENMQRVEFNCNDDAKDYLEQNFGVGRGAMRTRADIVKAGTANGIEIVFV